MPWPPPPPRPAPRRRRWRVLRCCAAFRTTAQQWCWRCWARRACCACLPLRYLKAWPPASTAPRRRCVRCNTGLGSAESLCSGWGLDPRATVAPLIHPLKPPPSCQPTIKLPIANQLQAGDRAGKKKARAEARGVARKALKLLAGPLLEASPSLAPRAAPLLAAALLVNQACGPKVAASAAKSARQLDHPLLVALKGLPLPREGGEEAEHPAPKSAKKSKKGAAAVADAAKEQQRSAAAEERRKTAADAAYNARVVAALASRAAAEPAAAATLVQLLTEAAAGEQPGVGRAEPLLLMTAHAAVQLGGAGAAAVAAALLQQLQRQPAASTATVAAVEALPRECFEESGVPTGALLERYISGQLTVPSLRSTTLLAALRAVPWADLAPRGSGKVRGYPAGRGVHGRSAASWIAYAAAWLCARSLVRVPLPSPPAPR